MEGVAVLDLRRDQDFGKGVGWRPVAGARRGKGRNLPAHGLQRSAGKEDFIIDEGMFGRLEVTLVRNGGHGKGFTADRPGTNRSRCGVAGPDRGKGVRHGHENHENKQYGN